MSGKIPLQMGFLMSGEAYYYSGSTRKMTGGAPIPCMVGIYRQSKWKTRPPPSGKPAGIEQPFKIGIKIREDHNGETRPEMIPEVPLAPELFP